MTCHECARTARDVAAVGACRFCGVGLCKDHLIASSKDATVPQYGCEHHPELAFAASLDRPTVGHPRMTPLLAE